MESETPILNYLPTTYYVMWAMLGFPDSSVGKESTCNVGDPGLIPGSGRAPGEGIGYALQCSWAPLKGGSWTSLVAQRLKRLPAMEET